MVGKKRSYNYGTAASVNQIRLNDNAGALFLCLRPSGWFKIYPTDFQLLYT